MPSSLSRKPRGNCLHANVTENPPFTFWEKIDKDFIIPLTKEAEVEYLFARCGRLTTTTMTEASAKKNKKLFVEFAAFQAIRLLESRKYCAATPTTSSSFPLLRPL